MLAVLLLAAPLSAGAEGPLPKPIHYKGGHDFTNPKTKRVVRDLPGTVVFVKEKEPPDAQAWRDVQLRPHNHYCPQYCMDVNNHVKGWKHGINVLGPGAPFKVANRFIWGQTGGAVYAILADGLTIGFGHLTQISARVHRAAQTGEELPAGTYLGSFTARIGVNDSPHMHLQAWKSADDAVKGRMNKLVLRSVWFPRLKAPGGEKPAPESTQGPRQASSRPSFPAQATLAEKLGFRTGPGLEAGFVIRGRNYLPVGTRLTLIESKPAFGAPGAFCKVQAAGKQGYIRCDKPSALRLSQ